MVKKKKKGPNFKICLEALKKFGPALSKVMDISVTIQMSSK